MEISWPRVGLCLVGCRGCLVTRTIGACCSRCRCTRLTGDDEARVLPRRVQQHPGVVRTPFLSGPGERGVPAGPYGHQQGPGPYRGRAMGRTVWSGASSRRTRRTIVAMAVISSVSANLSPMHLCLPAPKGRNAPGGSVCSSSDHRSGSKVRGSGKSAGSRCNACWQWASSVPAGHCPGPETGFGEGAARDEPSGVVQPRGFLDDPVRVRKPGDGVEGHGLVTQHGVQFVQDRCLDVGMACKLVQHRSRGLRARHRQGEGLGTDLATARLLPGLLVS